MTAIDLPESCIVEPIELSADVIVDDANKDHAPPRKARKPKTRSMRYDALVGTLTLTVNGKPAGTYWVDRLEAPAGCVAVRLTKFVAFRKAGEPDSYEVLVGPAERQCCCKGFSAHGHCKHGDSLAALVARGDLS